MSLRSRLAQWRAIHWIFAGLASIAVLLFALGVVFLWALADAFDSDRNLADFKSPGESRAFVSAHLPVALPADAKVTDLRYERFTDWHLTAKVRLASAEAVISYIEGARTARTLNDAYCGNEEPGAGARYFLSDVSACGTLEPAGDSLSVRCYTR